MFYLIVLLYFKPVETPFMLDRGPMSYEQCHQYVDHPDWIRAVYKADGIDVMCILKGREM